MATVTAQTQAPAVWAERRAASALWTSRLVLGYVVLAAVLIFILGGAWDIQWHTDVGRDRTFTTPHLFLLGGVALSGTAALIAILVESVWARRSPGVAASSTPFLGYFRGPLGAYLAGFGALASTVAFPLDDYWHRLYGIDVTLWAPFHVMILTGAALAGLGATYVLALTTHGAAADGAPGLALAARVGTTLSLASLLSLLLTFAIQAYDPEGLVRGPFGLFEVYPVMTAVFGAFVLAAAPLAFRRPGSATAVALAYLLIRQAMFWFVPRATDWLVQVERQSYRAGGHHLPVAPDHTPQWPVLAAVLIDLAVWLALRRGWPVGLLTTLAAIAGFLIVARLDSGWMARFQGAGFQRAYGPFDVAAVLRASYPWTALGALAGAWFGLGLGESLRRLKG
jgi:hypothetical protein